MDSRHTKGVFKTKNLGKQLKIVGTEKKYTLEKIEFVSKLSDNIKNNIFAETVLTKRDTAKQFAVSTISAPGRGKQYVIAYGSTADMPTSGYPPRMFQPKLTWAGGYEGLTIQASTLIKGGTKQKRFLLSKDVDCMVFTSAKQLQDSIIKGLLDRKTKEHTAIAGFLELYFSGDLTTMNTTEIDRINLLQVAKYVGELFPGIAAFRKANMFRGLALPLFDIKEFIIPISSNFATVDSAIITKNKQVILISSKADGGADASFIPNVIAATESKYLQKSSYFKKLVKYFEKNNSPKGPSFVYGLMNEILGTNIMDPHKTVFSNVRLYGEADNDESKEVVEKIQNYNFDSLDVVTAPSTELILRNLPRTITSFLGRVVANNVMKDRTSIDQISKVLGTKAYYQFNLKKIKEDVENAPIQIDIGAAGDLKFILTAGKASSQDVTMKQGVLNFQLKN